jgi:glycosyltransferase involved in cell wall biosynthesis
VNSANAQSVDCVVKCAVDNNSDGAGVTRNRLLETVDTPFVVFLDADDWIHEDFVKECLRVIRPTRYAYTDWWQGPEHTKAPRKPWCNGSWHVITSLLYTQDVRAVGGFDETLPALEDTDFYLKLSTQRHVCGIHVTKPLFYYSKDGRRSHEAVQNGDADIIRQKLLQKYGGMMGCCGGNNSVQNDFPVGVRQPGDVLAMAMWRGNRPVMGMATGRMYPRMSYPKTAWVDPRDIEKRPNEWQRVPEVAVDEQPTYEGIGGLAQAMQDGGLLDIREADYTPIIADEKPDIDVSGIVAIAKKRVKK